MSKTFDLILFNPPSPWLISDQDLVPLGLLYLASYIEQKGHIVKIIDLSGGRYKEDYDIPESDYYGISFVSPQFVYAKEILKKIKSKYPNKPVLAGGIHATSLPQQVLDAGFDAVVRGEGELSLEQILENGIEQKIYPIKFIKNIDTLPMPAYHLIHLEDYVKNIGVMGYMESGKEEEREINIMGTRGCPGRCGYCNQFKGPLRWRTPENIIGEIEFLQKEYGVNRISFCDDNLVVDKKWFAKLCFLLKENGIKWHGLARTDGVDYETCKMMKDSGCMGIDFGVESGSQKTLDVIRKDVTVERQEKGLRDAYKAGVRVRAQIMVGLPKETEEDFKKTLDFIIRNDRYVAKWGVHVFIPFPSCDIYRRSEYYGYGVDKNTDFSNFQTIGKPGEWNFVPKENQETIARWRDTLLNYLSRKNIFAK